MLLRSLLILTFFINACATNYHKLDTKLDKVKPKLNSQQSFAFVYQGDEYYFAPDYFKQDGRNCYVYLGFKNNDLAYTFSNQVFYDIEKVYKANDNPDKIKKLILDRVANEKPTEKRCYELGSKPPSLAQSADGIAYLILGFPLILPYAAYAVFMDQYHRGVFRKFTPSIHLGMTFHDVPMEIKQVWKKKTKGKYTYYELTEREHSNENREFTSIFYFENAKLNAWSNAVDYIR